jgi:hypothetical protein
VHASQFLVSGVTRDFGEWSGVLSWALDDDDDDDDGIDARSALEFAAVDELR